MLVGYLDSEGFLFVVYGGEVWYGLVEFDYFQDVGYCFGCLLKW